MAPRVRALSAAAVSFVVSFGGGRRRSREDRDSSDLQERTSAEVGEQCGVDLENRRPSRDRGFKSLRLRSLTRQTMMVGFLSAFASVVRGLI